MRVKISDLEFEFRNTLPGMKKMFAQIDDTTTEFQVYFSHLVVDGVEVPDAPFEYVKQNLKDIREVEVAIMTANEYMLNVMGVMDSYLTNAVPGLKDMADEFYGRPDDETWQRFNDHMNGLSTLLQIIHSLLDAPGLVYDKTKFAQLGEEVGLHLENINAATRLNDYTMVADIIKYEMVSFLEQMHGAVNHIAGSQTDVAH